MRVITWNRSFKGLLPQQDDARDNFDTEELETHATVLDKMLAWEKKLYDEVKVRGDLLFCSVLVFDCSLFYPVGLNFILYEHKLLSVGRRGYENRVSEEGGFVESATKARCSTRSTGEV